MLIPVLRGVCLYGGRIGGSCFRKVSRARSCAAIRALREWSYRGAFSAIEYSSN